MKEEGKQGILFGNNSNNSERTLGVAKADVKTTLKSNRRPEEERPYLIKSEGDKDGEVLRYYNLYDMERMRGMEYVITPIIDLDKKIKSIVNLPNLVVACEICEELTEEQRKENGIEEVQRGTVRIGYDAGDFRIVCEQHKPKSKVEPEVESKVKVRGRVKKKEEMTDYTQWINNH